MFSNNYPGKAVHFLRVNYTKKRSKRQLTPNFNFSHGFTRIFIENCWDVEYNIEK